MKRSIKGSAVFAATLVTAGLMTSTVAFADRQVIALQLDPICSDAASGQAMFALQNKNDFDLPVTWKNLDTGATGNFVVPANSFNGYDTKVGFATSYDPSLPNNTTSFTAEGWTSPATTNVQENVACNTDQLPTVTPPTDNGGNGGNGGDNTGNTGDTGGRGGDVLADSTVAAPVVAKQATLAYTGASQVLPYSIAALIAVATLGMTLAVRKNWL